MPPQPPPPRKDFPAFPFTPYPIQSEFMSFLYGALSSGPGALALLESPTGTGKTLSIICSALQWLLDRRDAPTTSPAHPSGAGEDDDEPDWMRDFTPLPPEKENTKKTTKPPAMRKTAGSGRPGGFGEEDIGEDEGEFLLEEYESDGEDEGRRGAGKRAHCGSSSSSEGEELDEEEEEVTPKVYFTSRTHSQLSQFVGELKRTEFSGKIRTVCLGSRKNLCINKDVLKLGSANRINERCLELQKNKKSSKVKVEDDKRKARQAKSSCGCPMLRNRSLQKEFRSEVSNQGALDIEDLAHIGKTIGTCPYYGSRDMVRSADLVVLPYQSLLLKSARESLGLNLKNSVVIIDEAHNLADSLTNMYNSKITSSQLKAVLSHLDAYLNRFHNVLGAGNRRYIQTLTVLTRSFLRVLTNNEDGASTMSSMTINQFLFSLDIDNINIVKLCQYVKESNVIHKVSGYSNKITSIQDGVNQFGLQQEHDEGSSIACFQALVDFLRSLLNSNDDGRIIVAKQKLSGQPEEAYLKFVMLCAEKIFLEVTRDAHAVILAGGTLQPIEETRLRLCPSLSSADIKFFTCNHIVPPECILPIAVTRGPSGMTFDFSYNSRSSPSMVCTFYLMTSPTFASATLAYIVKVHQAKIVAKMAPVEGNRTAQSAVAVFRAVSKEASFVSLSLILVVHYVLLECTLCFVLILICSCLQIEELGRFICNIVKVVPEGIVMFFSSYDYERRVYDAWTTAGTISKICKKKHIFREPRNSADVEAVFHKYKETIQSCSKNSQDTGVNGALLLAVVGGKISEGINFSDGMGRCVIMVGLPYPSPSDVELIETIKHIETISSSFLVGDDKASGRKYDDGCELQPDYDILRKCSKGGREYYENLCMKAVNQSIGRAIRHINDYAAMLLVDSRYAQASSIKSFSCPTDKLPQWIKARLSCAQNYGEVHRLLHQFFKFNKQKR
ncbi:putative ATP-dependent DNA helicase DDX11 [Dichanthelium oligosanthes]|uniref:Putative ATP-dependent DNA helicase DDX11 n=1 Tax=Dichanthelium oligosanthes TaxID=888268 RepID=A0A1E5WAX7_9POAL|nr:putative ATP-dependent DNA helicase DDX11 [Dichanthelium oligosanthes]